MRRTLAFYVGKELTILIITSYLSLLMFFSIFELAEFMRVVAQAKKPTTLAWELAGWNLLIITNDVAPLALLVAVTLLGAALGRRGEIVAVAAAGIAARAFLLPVITILAVFCSAFFFIANNATPVAAARVEAIMAGQLGRASSAQYFSRHRQWFHAGDKFVRVGSIDARAQTYIDMSIVTMKNGRMSERATAASVHAVGAELVAQNVTIEVYPDDNEADLRLRQESEAILPLERGFNLFLDLFSRPQNMRLDELWNVFNLRKRHGYNPRIYENEYWGRIAAPFASLALASLGAVLAFSVRAKRSQLFSLFDLLALTMLGFTLRQGFRALSSDGILAASAAALLPALVLSALAVWRVRRVQRI